jgi:hypothetical protein
VELRHSPASFVQVMALGEEQPDKICDPVSDAITPCHAFSQNTCLHLTARKRPTACARRARGYNQQSIGEKKLAFAMCKRTSIERNWYHGRASWDNSGSISAPMDVMR